jgi:hypothetical protein
MELESHGMIRNLDILSEGVAQMNYNATGMKISMDAARSAHSKEFCPGSPNKRIYADLTITDEPDDMTLHRDNDEQWKNYSVGYDWLKDFTEFCLKSKGFQIY